ncbi:MAG TPA: Crp/Fnr family transcriptional regulator [Solirubrobacteraceae bacterium]
MLEAHVHKCVDPSPSEARPDAHVHVSLVEWDSEFAEAVNGDYDRARRALQAHGYWLPAGSVTLPMPGVPETTFALLTLRGSLVRQTRAADGRMIEFVSNGDLLMPFSPHGEVSRGGVTLTATEEVLVAALDQRFLRAAAVWPELMINVQRRLSAQQHRLALHGAICQLPRVEQRLMALMWHLADRDGKVSAEGIILDLPLSHQSLADLVGARRPTVSLALKALRERDRLRRRPDGRWLLPIGSNGCAVRFEDVIGDLNGSARFDPIRAADTTAPHDAVDAVRASA